MKLTKKHHPMTNSYEIKYNLIVESCRIEPDHDKIQNYIRDIDDWPSVLNISYAHGVLPLVYKALKKQKNFPQEVLNMFKIQNIQIAQKNMQMTAELVRIVKLFDENDIDVLAFKGPALSQIIHGNVIDRQYADIDILIKEHNIYQAATLLLKNMYKPLHSIEYLKNKILIKIDKDFTFYFNNTSIELHWRLFSSKQIKNNIDLFKMEPDRIFLFDYEFNILPFDMNILYLTLHGSKHLWERIEWILDVDRLVRLNYNKINFTTIHLQSTIMKIETMYLIGLYVSNLVFKTPLPLEILELINSNKKVMTVSKEIVNNIYLNNNFNEDVENCLVSFSKINDTLIQKIRYKFLILFQIQKGDIYLVNLPRYLHFVYYIIRFIRLIYNTKYIKLIYKKLTNSRGAQ